MLAIDENIGKAGAGVLGAIGVAPIADAGNDAGVTVNARSHVSKLMLCSGRNRRSFGGGLQHLIIVERIALPVGIHKIWGEQTLQLGGAAVAERLHPKVF